MAAPTASPIERPASRSRLACNQNQTQIRSACTAANNNGLLLAVAPSTVSHCDAAPAASTTMTAMTKAFGPNRPNGENKRRSACMMVDPAISTSCQIRRRSLSQSPPPCGEGQGGGAGGQALTWRALRHLPPHPPPTHHHHPTAATVQTSTLR